MALTLSPTESGDTALAFAPEELDAVRAAITRLYGAIRRPWVTAGDLGFGDESFTFDDKTQDLRLISLTPKGADMLRVLAAELGAT
jgi:hypothetical protein